MNGKHEIKQVSIDPSIINNKDQLEKLFTTAFNDTVRKIEAYTANKMMDGISSGILKNLADIKLPVKA